MLVVFGGLPGTGKTTLARAVASLLDATFLRVDSVEVALQRLGLPCRCSPRTPPATLLRAISWFWDVRWSWTRSTPLLLRDRGGPISQRR